MKKNRLKLILFSFIPLITILLIVEIGGRVIYFQKKSEYGSVIGLSIEKLLIKYKKWSVKHKIGTDELPTKEDFFLKDKNKEKLLKSAAEYSILFEKFYKLTVKNKIDLIVLYIPPEGSIDSFGQNLFKKLTSKFKISFIDMTDIYSKYEKLALYNPLDSHPNAFGNYLVAKKLTEYFKHNPVKKSPVSFLPDERPEKLGMWPKNDNKVYLWNLRDPFWVIINNQGLRGKKNVVFPKPKDRKRILAIGDSFTFGHGVNEDLTYPNLLENELEKTDVINAGMAGKTLIQEYYYLTKMGLYTEPDLIILQVLDNDLYELLPAIKFIFGQN